MALLRDSRLQSGCVGDLLFSNRIFPIMWPSCIDFKYPRSTFETNPSSKYDLGKCSLRHPFRFFIAGPKIRNRAIMSYVAMVWMVPLTRVNTCIMELQYSLKPTSLLVKSYLYRNVYLYRTYSQVRQKTQKIVAKVESAQETISSTKEKADNAMEVAEDIKSGKTSAKAYAKSQVVPITDADEAGPS